MNRHFEIHVDKLKTHKFCNSEYLYYEGGVYEIPFKTEPTLGRHDFNTCEGCQKNLIGILRVVKSKLEQFPNCCERHAKLSKAKFFNKKDFEGLETMIAIKTIYSHQHIVNNLDKENWYEDISNYLEYTIKSFGSFPSDYGEPLLLSSYLSEITEYLENNKKAFNEEKRLRLLEFVRNYTRPVNSTQTDINVLLGVYEKWYKIFPFDLSYFSGVKEYYEKNIPILKEKPVYNPYLKVSSARLLDKDGLIKVLLERTNYILTHINSLKMYEKGLISNADNIKLELVVKSREKQLEAGYINNSKDEGQRYRKIIKKWFEDEKKFIDEIKPLLNKNDRATKVDTELPKSIEDIFLKPEYAKPCLDILRELNPAVIDQDNNYIGKNKGVFPLWIKVLRGYKSYTILKHFKDHIYKEILNKTFSGLNLTKDASEFRKNYSRLNRQGIELDMKTILSQFSQKGRLGK